jgi:heme exporter protein D
MNWESLSAFVAMGGYGAYVWGSFGVTAACAVIELVTLSARRRRLLRERAERAAE